MRMRVPEAAATRNAAANIATIADDAPFVLAVVDLGAGRLSREDRDLMGAARTLADALSGGVAMLAFLPPGGDLRGHPGNEGADRVLRLTDPAYAEEDAEPRVAGVLAAAEGSGARHLLFSDTPLGRELARRAAARLGDRAALDVRRLAAEELTADIDAGRTEVRRALPRVIVPAKGMFASPAGPVPREARPMAIEASPSPRRVVPGDALPLDPATLPLAEADLIISAGNGLVDWEAFHEAARLLGAAEAGSRVVCDAGLLPRTRQVGASGILVEPRCYLAFGIAGASQHLQGIAGAERVVAVNTDLRAEMIKRADLAIVADAQAVLPALVRCAQARRSSGAPPSSAFSRLTSVSGGTNDLKAAPSQSSEFGGGVLVLVSIGKHPVSLRPRRADFDARALELALATGQPVTALHAGRAGDNEPVLRDYLGTGAAEIMVLGCAADDDPLGLLEDELRSRRPRLVVAGSQAEAGEGSGMLPFLLAERLGYAIATDIVDISFTQTGIRLVKALPGGRRRVLETTSPLLVTVDRRGPAPRLSARMPALRGPLRKLPATSQSRDDRLAWSLRPGRQRPRRLAAPSIGGTSADGDARREMIAPDADAAAEAILNFLERDGLLAIAKEASS